MEEGAKRSGHNRGIIHRIGLRSCIPFPSLPDAYWDIIFWKTRNPDK